MILPAKPRAAARLTLVLFIGCTAWSLEPKRQIYVIGVKPPSISSVDSQDLKITGTAPLAENPAYALMSPDNKHIYVLHNGAFSLQGNLPKEPGELSIVDSTALSNVKKVKLGWNTSRLSLSKDGRYLLCFSGGRAAFKKLSQEPGSVTIIDTVKNEEVANLSLGRLGKEVLGTSDLSRIFVLSAGEGARKKKDGTPPAKPALTVFSLNSEKPLAEIEFDYWIKEMALSRDEKSLYLLDPGDPNNKPQKNRNGVVHVVDVANAKLVASHDVGTSPRGLEVDANNDAITVLAQASAKDHKGKLYSIRDNHLTPAADLGSDPQFVTRFGNRTDRTVVSHDDLRFLGDDGQLTSSFVALNPKGDSAGGASLKRIGGYPGEVLYLPDQKKAVMTVMGAGGVPTSKVAIVNLNDNTVENVVTTGRGSVKFGKFMGSMALSVAMSMGSYYAGYSYAQATSSPYFFYNVYLFTPKAPNLELTASADGKFVYALNTQTNDVTIVDSGTGAVLDKVPVGGNCQRIMTTPAGRFVWSHTLRQVDLIDTQTNKKHLEHKLASGKINGIYVDEPENRVLALTTNSMLVFDAGKGSLVSTVEGLGQPYLLVLPQRGAGE
jgi:YVTN family beta-propeller protein